MNNYCPRCNSFNLCRFRVDDRDGDEVWMVGCYSCKHNWPEITEQKEIEMLKGRVEYLENKVIELESELSNFSEQKIAEVDRCIESME